MSETKFTKGDWTIDYGQTKGHIKAVNINDLSRTPTVAIYNIFSRHGKGELTKKHEEQENANAQLISAAPDMYFALENLLSELEDCSLPSSINFYIHNAKVALNKAVGL